VIPSRAELARNIRARRRMDMAFAILGAFLVVLALGVLAVLVTDLLRDGASRLSLNFLNSFPSRHPERAGIKSPLVGTCLIMIVTAFTAIPLGIAAGLYLEEYARRNWLTTIIEINIANLAGVPSIIWGLMALGLLVYQLNFGRSILTGGLTLGLLVLPIVIVATRESVRAIPQSIREASYACGATRFQTVRYHILPYSMSGVLTGAIVALSRAIGETAPLITIGALTYIAFLPPVPFTPRLDAAGEVVGTHGPFDWINSSFTVLPIQLFNWVSRPDTRFQVNAAATGLVLVVITLGMNGIAIWLRYRLRRRIQW
jgi:phosphate transport system permease protein